VEVTKDWIEPVIDMMEKDKTIGAAQPKMLSFNNKKMFEYAGAAGGWIDYLGYPFARGRVFDVCEADKGQYNDESNIFWASGAALFVRAELFHQLKGFDHYFFAHMEEIDFCWRLQLSGNNVYACPKSVVYHVGAGTLKKESAQKTFLNFRNNLIMLAKNLPLVQSCWKIPFRILLDAISGFRFLFSGGGIYFIAILKAHVAFISWLLFNKKESVFPPDKTIKPQGWLNKSIVWQYFVSGKKTFAEIVQNKS
jgi:GT2 family glycosyltransferase